MSKYTIEDNPLGYPTDEAFRLVEEIKWKSIEKDNMEFQATITCFQREALQAIINYARGMY